MPSSVNKKTYFYLGFILFLITFFHYLHWLTPVEIFLRSLIIPPVTGFNRLASNFQNRLYIFKNNDKLIADNTYCQTQLQNQAVIRAQLTIVAEENAELRKQLAFESKEKTIVVVAEVVGKEINSVQQIIIINRGSKAGIKNDEPVTAGEGIIVGKIIKVEPDISLALLINDPQSKIAATILSHDHSLGIVEGGYGISLQMRFIPRNENVLIGDQIITSGLETSVPRGLLIGTVAAVENEAYNPFQQAILTSNVDLSKLTIVGVVLTR